MQHRGVVRSGVIFLQVLESSSFTERWGIHRDKCAAMQDLIVVQQLDEIIPESLIGKFPPWVIGRQKFRFSSTFVKMVELKNKVDPH